MSYHHCLLFCFVFPNDDDDILHSHVGKNDQDSLFKLKHDFI